MTYKFNVGKIVEGITANNNLKLKVKNKVLLERKKRDVASFVSVYWFHIELFSLLYRNDKVGKLMVYHCRLHRFEYTYTERDSI